MASLIRLLFWIADLVGHDGRARDSVASPLAQ